MKHILNAFVMICALALFAAPASAKEKLSGDNVSKFIKALPDIEVFSDDLKKTGKDKQLDVALKPTPGDKSYSPYAKGIEIMKDKLPADYKNLGGIVEKHGFNSQEEWANTGDSVMLAYMATKIEQENPDALKQLREIPEESKAKMSPETKAQLDQSILMMEIFTSAPAQDKEAVKPYLAQIDSWLERSKQEGQKEQKPATPPAAETKKSAQ